MTAYRPGLPAPRVHAALERALQDLQQAEHNAVLWFSEIARRRLYRDLGYATIHLYAEKALGFSRTKTYQFLRLAEDLERLPVLKRAVAEGSVSWTKACEVANVAVAGSEVAWVEKARRSTVRELRRDIGRARTRSHRRHARQPELLPAEGCLPEAATPITVALRLRPTAAARFDRLLELIQKRGETGTREDLILGALDVMSRQKSQRRDFDSGSQIVISKCPDCGAARAKTGRGFLRISPAELAAAECDATVLEPGRRARRTIPPSIRRQVLIRDGYRCRTPGCRNTRFLEIHHRVPRSRGGTHAPANLLTLCSACHLHAHG
ncbi:HNH endonuclease [bacterium]|nr:HNH endonuclease [bacterium]